MATEFNEEIRREARTIGLILDNTTCRLKIETSNVRLIFLPPNTTGILQPLDAGVIRSFKAKFCRHQLARILAEYDHGAIEEEIPRLVSEIEWFELKDVYKWTRHPALQKFNWSDNCFFRTVAWLKKTEGQSYACSLLQCRRVGQKKDYAYRKSKTAKMLCRVQT